MMTKRYFHLHLISDSTGETINAVAKAVCAQFESAHALTHSYGLVRAPKQLERAMRAIEKNPGPVFFTLMNQDLRTKLEKCCVQLSIPHIAVLDPFIGTLADYLHLQVSGKAGSQHIMDRDYFRRISALNYTMAHDDGQNQNDLNDADIIITGVSRTSKTPTCVYLANRGIRAANVPYIVGMEPPPELLTATQPLIVGFTISPERLVQIRKARLLSLKEATSRDYVDSEAIRTEITDAKRLFARQNWPIIDVSRRSIEEVATTILNLYQDYRDNTAVLETRDA